MIIKNIYVKIHPFFYFFMFVALFTGEIRDFLIFTCIIMVHECGHVFGGLFFGWNVKSVTVLPFGGLTIFNCYINENLYRQFLVSILGPLFQIVFFLLFNLFFDMSNKVIYYNLVLLIFNLLPIFPLDGSKILNSILCLFLPFKVSHIISIIVSFICLLVLVVYIKSFLCLIICFFLLINIIKELCNHKFLFNKFLFERYNYHFSFKREIVVKKVNMMKLNCRHIFFLDGNYYTEKKILSKRFDNTHKL